MGPDREVGAELCALFEYVPDAEYIAFAAGYEAVYRVERNWGGEPVVAIRPAKDGEVFEMNGCARRPQHVTSSLDAALALVEWVRPDWYPEVCRNYRGNPPSVPAWSSDLYSPTRQQTFEASAATPPLALLTALLKSLAHAE